MVKAGKPQTNASTALGLYTLICGAELETGDHVHRVWRGQVATPEMPRAKKMALKWLDGDHAIGVELACALAAQCFGIPVPAPGIVIALREFLPGLPPSVAGETIILIGSEFKDAEIFYSRATPDNRAVEEFVWQRLCASETGPVGAAWDELVANEDRHYQNALFDGTGWWLFDHDRALMSAGPFCKAPIDIPLRLELKEFRAKCNHLAQQVVSRHRVNHGISDQPAKFNRHKEALSLQAEAARKWFHPDAKIQKIFVSTAILLEAIELRLPALAIHLQARTEQPSADDLWTQGSI